MSLSDLPPELFIEYIFEHLYIKDICILSQVSKLYQNYKRLYTKYISVTKYTQIHNPINVLLRNNSLLVFRLITYGSENYGVVAYKCECSHKRIILHKEKHDESKFVDMRQYKDRLFKWKSHIRPEDVNIKQSIHTKRDTILFVDIDRIIIVYVLLMYGEIHDKSDNSPRKFVLGSNITPSSLVCNSNQDIYILNSKDHHIYVYDLNGIFKRTIILNKSEATSININSNDLLYVCYKTEIHIYNKLDEYIDKLSTGIPFININQVVFDSDNDIIVADDSGIFCMTLYDYLK